MWKEQKWVKHRLRQLWCRWCAGIGALIIPAPHYILITCVTLLFPYNKINDLLWFLCLPKQVISPLCQGCWWNTSMCECCFKMRMSLLSCTRGDKLGRKKKKKNWAIAGDTVFTDVPRLHGRTSLLPYRFSFLKAIIPSSNAAHLAQVMLKRNRQLENQAKTSITQSCSLFN